jgi:rubrerythrin
MSAGAIEAIKGAILLERRGWAFYSKVATTTKSESVREVFSSMAEEEKRHEEALSLHYSSLVRDGSLAAVTTLGQASDISGEILSRKVISEIDAAGYEAAAISAAMAMEASAEKYYRERASEAGSGIEGDLFNWLADWEHGHLEMLAQMDRALMEKIWFENSFWPVI